MAINNINNKAISFFELSLLNVIFFILAKKITNIIRGKMVTPNSISWIIVLKGRPLIIAELNFSTSGYKNKDLKNMYCEHFDVIKNIYKIINKESIIIFNVNRHPFDYEKFPIW